MGTEFIFVVLYLLSVLLVIEISSLLFRLIGLEKEVARYQAISMLTSTGFTTDESQLIIDHPVRRRISIFLILFGAFSLAVMISIISTMLSNDLRLTELIVIGSILLVILVIGKLPIMQKKLKKIFHHEMHKNWDICELPVKEGLCLKEDDVVTEIGIEEKSKLKGKKCRSYLNKKKILTCCSLSVGK